MRSRAYGPNWPRCAPIWRFCSTPTCRTGLRSKPIGARPAPTATGRPARNPRAGSPPAGSTPRTARTSRRTPRKARSSTCLPNRIRPRPTGCRNRVTAVRTADRRRQSRRGCAIAWRSRRARGHHRQRHCSPRLSRSRSPHPSPNSLGSHRNRSAHPPRRRTATAAAPRAGAGRHRRAPSRSRVAQTPPPEPEPVAQTPPDWQPAPAEGEWIPAGAPGSNWVSPAVPDSSAQPTGENGSAGEYVGKRRAPEPAMQSRLADLRRGRHSAPPDAVDPGRPPAPPTLAAESGGPPPHPEPEPPPEPPPAQPAARRHRSTEDTGGQSVAELLARLQATPTGGGRRRRRDE